MLESREGTEKSARFSFIGFDPIFEFKSKGKLVNINGNYRYSKDPYGFLRKKFYSFDIETVDSLPFSIGLVGYFSYEIINNFESLPSLTEDTLNLPDLHFILPSKIICFDHRNKKYYLVSLRGRDGFELNDIIEYNKKETRDLIIQNTEEEVEKRDFSTSVEKAKEYIKNGDAYQIVLSRRKKVGIEGDRFEIYKRLRDINPSPYLFYLNFDETKIIGSSPEMLVKLKNRKITTRPLAGTRKRAKDPEMDEKYKLDMLLDQKERSEHLMLVDLHRNDIGKVSEYGTVKVTELMGIEKYSHVQHLVSNVVGQLRKKRDSFDVLKSCFPAGTVTGAPKIRAMEIIEELENVKRGPYGGAVGFFDFSGNMEFAITIRSIFTKGDHAYIQAGAGIVDDSIPEREYAETEEKMEAMIKTMEDK